MPLVRIELCLAKNLEEISVELGQRIGMIEVAAEFANTSSSTFSRFPPGCSWLRSSSLMARRTSSYAISESLPMSAYTGTLGS